MMIRRYARLLILPVLLLATASLGGCYVSPYPYAPRYAYAPVYYHHYYWYR